MENQELNTKLAQWRGFTWHDYQVFESEYKDTRIDDPYWEYPNGRKCKALPDFVHSADLCFKWLVPNIDRFSEVQLIKTGKGWACRIVLKTTTGHSWYQRAVTPALALCKAIESLINASK